MKNISHKSQVARLRICCFFLLTAVCYLLPAASGWTQEIPVSKEMAAAVRPITTDEEVAMGKEVAANVLAQFGMVQNDPLTDYVSLVGLTVAQCSPRQDVPYHFAILDSDIVNAFAAPGGYIFVTKGLLNLLQDEAQLASILGHEIAHVAQRHVTKEIQKSKIAEAVIPSYVKASAKQAEWMSQITDLAIQMIWKGYSREDELEADKLGVEYARAAGYDAQSYAEVLEMIRNRTQETTSSREYKFLLSTHPKPEERIRIVTERLKTIPLGGERVKERLQKSVSPNQ